jgi:hypothetical protein
MVGSTFVSDAELTTWVNQGFAELYDLVVSAFEDYFTTSTTFTVSSGNTQALPATFYKLRGLDFSINGSYQACRQFNFNERNDSQNDNAWMNNNVSARSYRIMGDNLLLQPTLAATGDYKLWFVPAPTFLVADSDLIPDSLSKFGWDEYIVLYAAERMLSKEESSITDVVAERGQIANRITSMSANRQVDQSNTIQDVQGDNWSQLDRWW